MTFIESNYTYDKMNRLLSGISQRSEALTYDNLGNIITLSRDGGTAGTYNYSGNRLTSITGGPLATPTTYTYDANGNTTTDGRLNKTYTYNVLNLPATVSGSSGITYTYNAIGEKLRKDASDDFDYINGIQYRNGSIEFIQTEEGLARRSGSSYSYEYNLKDHLGNTRVTFYRNPSSGNIEVLQRDDYYPFGLRYNTLAGSNDNKYLYNGKELQDELGQYDYGARFYDPITGRFNTIDPLSEQSRRFSSYSYGLNNPIRFIDVDGMYAAPPDLEVERQKNGTYNVTGGTANSDKNIYVMENGKRTGEVIGKMLTEHSFHHEDGSAVVGANININDQSGQKFFANEIKKVGLFEYMGNATGGELYDFKTRQMPEELTREERGQYTYRGMSFNGKIASARDIGNYSAGYVAGVHGMGWGASRMAFDALQSYQEGGFATEGQPTQRAQRAGHNIGYPIFQQRQWQKATNPWPIGPKW